MGQTPADHTPAEGGQERVALDELAPLDGIENVPLAEQVEVFQTIHDRLSARLSSAES